MSVDHPNDVSMTIEDDRDDDRISVEPTENTTEAVDVTDVEVEDVSDVTDVTDVTDVKVEDVTDDEPTDDDALIEQLSAQLQGGPADPANPVDPANPPAPEPEPLPTPDECVRRHLSKRLQAAMAARTDEEMAPMHAAHSLGEMALATERLEREMMPLNAQVQMWKKYYPRNGSKQQKAMWEKQFAQPDNDLTEAVKAFKAQRDELCDTVREFVHGLEDAEQAVRRASAYDRRPFSKGKRSHFWRAVEQDDHVALLRTLDDAETVQRARHAVFRPGDELEERALLCVLAGNRRGVPAGGASECLRAVLRTYPECFTAADRTEATAFVRERGLEEARSACVAALA